MLSMDEAATFGSQHTAGPPQSWKRVQQLKYPAQRGHRAKSLFLAEQGNAKGDDVFKVRRRSALKSQ